MHSQLIYKLLIYEESLVIVIYNEFTDLVEKSKTIGWLITRNAKNDSLGE